MKKIIALALILNATTAFAFFNDSATNGAFVQNSWRDVVSNVTEEDNVNLTIKISMIFTADSATAQDEKHNAYHRPLYWRNQYEFPAE